MPYIKDTCANHIKENSDIVKTISHFIEIKKKGANYSACCPFHNEKTPSFVISPSKEMYKCFGCGAAGNSVSFVMQHKNANYPEALEIIASLNNITVEYEDAEWAKEKEERSKQKEKLRPLLNEANKKYLQELKKLSENHPAIQEIKRREYDEDIIAEWEIGFAPGGKLIHSYAIQNKLLNQAKELGLCGEEYDKYWNRVTYPIRDINGLLVGIAGRDVSGNEDSAKWINPTNSIIYNKDKIWFGLNKAAKEITKQKEAWIVEGYNDVIAWHRHGLINTISPCGTAITKNQLTRLKRLTENIILCMDGDNAGKKSMLKNIPEMLSMGFRVFVVSLPDCDPDEYVRKHEEEIQKKSLTKLINNKETRKDGFQFLMEHKISGDDLSKAQGAKDLCKIISQIEDESYRLIYSGWLIKESKIPKKQIDTWIKTETESNKDNTQEATWYLLPKEVKSNLKELKPVIDNYGLFIDGNKIYVRTGDEKPFTFKEVSNFSIEIIQHMQDEKLPMKLLRIKNIHGEERIFDVPSQNLDTPQLFDTTMAGQGNFLWIGGRNEFQKLRKYLFDKMGVGQKIEVLGWQPDGFYLFNNAVVRPGEGIKEIDENGIYKNGKVSYYIPSANRIYQNNDFKFTPQKKVRLLRSNVTFSAYCSKMKEVHREHAITGILFTVASMFLDIIEDKLGNFPLLFLYGPPSSGKDQLIECCQSFFGIPQTPIHIGNKISTSKAQVRKFAQFRNIIVHLSEYRPGDQMLDELLKGFWDRRGYERGTIDSSYGTETVPINSSVIFTGNHYPDDDALITRVIAEEMVKTDFGPKEKKAYQELKDMYKSGISYITAEMVQHRKIWEDRFKETFRKVEGELKSDLEIAATHDRLISNVAVLGATYELMKDVVLFPFAYNDFVSHIRKGLDNQLRKLNTASVSMKWWDCLLAAIRTKQDPLRHGREFEVKDDKLYFNFTHTYNRVATQWWAQYHENVPGKSKISDMIKKDRTFIEEKSCHYMENNRTSVWVVDLTTIPIKNDLNDAIEWQKMEGTDIPVRNIAPATPDIFSDNTLLPENNRPF
jgi:DNA primase